MENEKHHIVSYKTYGLILLLLLTFTAISVAVTQIELSKWSTAIALLIAGTKSAFVLAIFMHLKFDQKIYRVMAISVTMLLIAVIIITFLDYLFR
jgi:cytochrome c oxidase subunit 4